MQLSENDIKQRLPVWVALSSLWLDTELQDTDYRHIANVLHKNNVQVQEAKQIHTYEVAPAVRINAMSVAGEWAFFDEGWLREQCSKNAAKRNQFWHRVSCKAWDRYYRNLTKACWVEIKKHHREMYPAPSPETNNKQ